MSRGAGRWAALVALIASALVLQLPSGPAQAADDPLDLPQGPATSVPFYDRETDTFHLGGAVLPSPVARMARNAVIRTTSSGIVIDRGDHRLVTLEPDGSSHVIAAQVAERGWRVRTGSRAGRQVAMFHRRAGIGYVEVRRTTDGSLVRRTEVGRGAKEILGFNGRKVWYAAPEYVDRTSRVTVLDIGSGRRIVKVLPSGRTPVHRDYVSVRLNLFGWVPYGPAEQANPVWVAPLTGHRFGRWRTDESRLLSASPDGRYVVTATGYDEDDYPDAVTVKIRNARTGRLLRTLPGDYGTSWAVTWEDSRTVLLPEAHHEEGDEFFPNLVTVRTDILTGAQERVDDGWAGVIGDEPERVYPSER